MRILLAAVISTLFACRSEQKVESETYPHEVDSLQCRDLYDSAKWYLYAWHCDVLYKPTSDSLVSKPFSELELRYSRFLMRHDALILSFNFIDNGEVILPGMTRDNVPFATAVGFDTRTREKIFKASANVYFSCKGDSLNRYVNPLQPEVIDFIKKNGDKLDPWFRKEAKRRKIL
ncbi:hypothetical protein SAMN05421788_103107 [Filimonas lacunae]|uniref:Lipoprotein n=2 Tax=Filimonas lacunae TaxID=477680 RepID=A0A1N7P1J1_9BACT|nr:hypothetical protein SAMN05421788_103107 [Filimonas lacunae]